jgi:hypothetical protein
MADDAYKRELEEAQSLQRQINHLVDRINSTNRENAQLEVELDSAIHGVNQLIRSAGEMDRVVNEQMHTLTLTVDKAEIKTTDVFKALVELTNEYFVFKNLSTASKNLSQFTDEYSTKFYYYNELRRITLGYVIGLDTNIVSSNSLRKKVEKAYLQNTEYWLAYCITAVMLWTSDEREAANRALKKSLSINYFNACLFYLLINLRFNRIDAAKKWYLNFLDKSDQSDLGPEWQYLLQAYLSGAFGIDEGFQKIIAENFKKLLAQIDLTTVDFARKFSTRAFEFADAYIYKSDQIFATLKRTCTAYEEIHRVLSDAEKIASIAKYYDTIYAQNEDGSADLPQRIENVLYSLINNYDDDELKIVKKLKYNEAIIAARGDLDVAQKNYTVMFIDENKKKSLADLLLSWAFASETNQTDNSVKKFSISFMKDSIGKGFDQFVETYRKRVKEKYEFAIDGFSVTCSEDEFEVARPVLEMCYEKNKFKEILSDKFVLIYMALCAAVILTFGIMIFTFSEVALTIAILVGLAASFLLWRRIVDVQKILIEKKRKGVLLLRQALTELKLWRRVYEKEDKNIGDLQYALQRF